VPPAPDEGSTFTYDVVIPTRRRPPGLVDQTIASVEGQTLPPRRIILVVDGNSDEAAAARLRWPHVEVIELAPRRGVAAARQAGIDAATSEWVAFVDDDDLWARHKMQVTSAFVREHPECQALRSTYRIFSSPALEDREFGGQIIDLKAEKLAELESMAVGSAPRNDMSYLDIHGDSVNRLLTRNAGVIGSTCVRLEVLRAIPPVPDGTQPGDDYLLFCLIATRAEWWLIDEPLLFYRIHPGQDTRAHASDGAIRAVRTRRMAWEICGESATRPLASYGLEYRREFRSILWSLARRGRMAETMRVYREALPLVPRMRDRLAMLVPEPVAWRWRYRIRARGSSGAVS